MILAACVCAVQIEELGSEGRVEEAQGMMKLVEQLKDEREQLSSTPSVSHTDGWMCVSALHTAPLLSQHNHIHSTTHTHAEI